MENGACCEAGVSTGKELQLSCKESIIDISRIGDPPNWPGCCIYRVPNKLRAVNEQAYTPKLISIGPFHHGREVLAYFSHLRQSFFQQEELSGFEPIKLEYFRAFCNRTLKSESDLLSSIKENEEKICHCYYEKPKLQGTKFQEMFLLDATFIIELFLRHAEREKYGSADYILSNPWITFHLQQDLILPENQLPYRFLQKFYRSAFDEVEEFPLIKLACMFFFPDGHRISMEKKVEHFTDLHRTTFCPTNHTPPQRPHHLIQTATKLDEAGLEFEKVELDWHNGSLLDIHFAKNKCLERFPCFNFSWLFACLPCFKRCHCFNRVQCILKVPQLEIDDQTETLFRNLMALEQCHYSHDTYICSYVMLLDSLITTKEDVRLLVYKEVLVNRLGSSNAVTTLINRLGLEIMDGDNCYYDLIERLTRHCKNPWNSLVASLRSLYFRDFWRGTATIIGLMVLGFTFWNFLKPFVL